MSIGIKIRILLVILGACCIITAITLNHTVSENDHLRHEAATLQENLSLSEQLVFNLLADAGEVENIKKLHENPDLALNFLNTYPEQEINVITYQGHEVKFWSSYLINPPPVNFVKEGVSVVQLSNGWYEAIKKTEGDFAAVFYIKIKSQFLIENNFLNNEISKKLLPSNALTFASFIDNEVVTIKSTTGKPLFEVKLRPGTNIGLFSTAEVWLWAIGVLSFSLFLNSLCSLIAKRGRLPLATLLLFAFFLMLRYLICSMAGLITNLTLPFLVRLFTGKVSSYHRWAISSSTSFSLPGFCYLYIRIKKNIISLIGLPAIKQRVWWFTP